MYRFPTRATPGWGPQTPQNPPPIFFGVSEPQEHFSSFPIILPAVDLSFPIFVSNMSVVVIFVFVVDGLDEMFICFQSKNITLNVLFPENSCRVRLLKRKWELLLID